MSDKHTPGPWTVDRVNDEVAIVVENPPPEAGNPVVIGWGDDESSDSIANAQLMAKAPALLEEVRKLRAEVAQRRQLDSAGLELVESLRAEIEKLRAWVDDLHSGMYINCVYCGHRYGPSDEVPASMAEVLKEHCEQCPEHPLSHAKAEIERLEAKIKRLDAIIENGLGPQDLEMDI